MIKKNFKYIDLFAGIGGFHQAMRRLGGVCVYACEKNIHCREFYNQNYNQDGHIKIENDIKTIDYKQVPEFDVLCAGFPCQSFSKAGNQLGFKDKERGDLFFNILDILDTHPNAKFVILENVRNLADNEANWDVIKKELMQRDFIITEEPIILSPHQFGIPQIRERVYILGIRKTFKNEKTLTNGYIHLEDLRIEDYMIDCPENSINLILDDFTDERYLLPDNLVNVLNAWSEFKRETRIGMVGKPFWLNSFGIGTKYDKVFKRHIKYDEMPDWKKEFVNWNRAFYLKNKVFIDDWANRTGILEEIKIHQKFEWNCGEVCENIRDGIIQIRQSGIRVKRPNFFPSLVAMSNTPIIWDVNVERYRYITPREAAKLQSFDQDIIFLENDRETYKQLGNSVNVHIIEILAERLFNLGRWRR